MIISKLHDLQAILQAVGCVNLNVFKIVELFNILWLSIKIYANLYQKVEKCSADYPLQGFYTNHQLYPAFLMLVRCV